MMFQSRAPLVVRPGNVPRRPLGVGGCEHRVAGAGGVVPPSVKREQQRGKVVLVPTTHTSRTIGVPVTIPPEEQVSVSA
jgi:hypothetical protein